MVSNNNVKPWTEISSKPLVEAYGRAIDEVTFEMEDGQRRDFHIKREGPACGVLALTPDMEVILVRQFRPGPRRILDELPGGFIEPGENELSTASRELFEETGFQGQLQFVGTCIDDAYSTMLRYCFVATDCLKVGQPVEDSQEPLQVVLCPMKQFRQQLRSGMLTDAEVAYMGLEYLRLL